MSVTPAQLPPQALDAERAILGAVFLRPSILSKVKGILTSDDFYREAHQSIYTAMCEVDEITPITINGHLTDKGRSKVAGGLDYLTGLLADIITSAGWKSHAEIIADKATRRRVIQMGEMAIHTARGNDPVEEVLSAIKTGVRDIEAKDAPEFISNKLLAEQVYEDSLRHESDGDFTVGVLTGYENIDRKVHGLRPGCSYYIGAFRSTGKSSLALNIAENIQRDHPESHILYFSLESTSYLLTVRRYAMHTGIASTRIQVGNYCGEHEKEDMFQALAYLEKSDLHVLDQTRFQSYPYLAAYCESYAMNNPLGLVIIDFLQLLSIPGKWDTRESYKEISKRINFLAKDLRCPVMVISQLNDDGKLKEARDIEDNADNVWILERLSQESEDVKVKCQKGKDTGVWTTNLRFDRFTQRFFDAVEESCS